MATRKLPHPHRLTLSEALMWYHLWIYYVGHYFEQAGIFAFKWAAQFYHWSGEHDDEGKLKYVMGLSGSITNRLIERDVQKIKSMTSEYN